MSIHLADDVLAEIGPGQAASVLSGDGVQPNYECITCHQPGDMRTQPSNGVLFTGGPDDPVILAWAHDTCAPSEVRIQEELLTGSGPRGPVGMEDVTSVSLAQLATGLTPTITVMPGMTAIAITETAGGGADVGSFRLQELLDFGFTRLNMGSPTQPAGPTGWTVRVDRGHLVSIGSGQIPWWTTNNRPAMPEHWRRAARQARQVLLIVVAPGTYPDVEEVDIADANRLLRQASAMGRVVGGLLPLRGTLS